MTKITFNVSMLLQKRIKNDSLGTTNSITNHFHIPLSNQYCLRTGCETNKVIDLKHFKISFVKEK